MHTYPQCRTVCKENTVSCVMYSSDVDVNKGDQLICKLGSFERITFVIFCFSKACLLLLIVYINVLCISFYIYANILTSHLGYLYSNVITELFQMFN